MRYITTWETKGEGEMSGGGVEKRRKNKYQYAGGARREMEAAQGVSESPSPFSWALSSPGNGSACGLYFASWYSPSISHVTVSPDGTHVYVPFPLMPFNFPLPPVKPQLPFWLCRAPSFNSPVP